MPPMTKLTPEERAKMLQAEFLETEETYIENLQFIVEVTLNNLSTTPSPSLTLSLSHFTRPSWILCSAKPALFN